MEKIKELYLKYKEIINYLIFGVLTTLISLIVYYACVFTFLNPDDAFQLQIANIFSWIAGVIFAYVTNRKYVFESKNNNKVKEASKFVTSRLVTLIMDMVMPPVRKNGCGKQTPQPKTHTTPADRQAMTTHRAERYTNFPRKAQRTGRSAPPDTMSCRGSAGNQVHPLNSSLVFSYPTTRTAKKQPLPPYLSRAT